MAEVRRKPSRAAPLRRVREHRTLLDLEGRSLPLRIRRHPRARRLTLRVDSAAEGAVVTIPASVPIEEGIDWAQRKSAWLLEMIEGLPPRVAFVDGAVVPFLGIGHRICHRPDQKGVVWRDNGQIHVTGNPEFLARRVTDWLRREARREIVTRVAAKAEMLGRPAGRIGLRDTRSRWGSCASNGNLSFCWRLIMAPERVLDYVVAHEVAHLAVRDHGDRFWATVATLTEDPVDARAWLRRHGEGLHRYG